MAPEAPKNSKSLTLSIPTAGKGPNGYPLVISTIDNPGAILGNVKFDCNYDCKGGDIFIEYTAMAEAKWSRRDNAQKRNISIHGRFVHDSKIIQMPLPHPKVGTVKAGQYSCPINIPIDAASMPSSFVGSYAWMTYRVKVILVRKFPSLDVTQEQVVWVLTSVLPRPQAPLPDTPLAMTRYNGTLNKTIPYICVIPSPVVYLGQQVPITIKILATQHPVNVESAVIKLKQYTVLRVKSEKKSDKKELLTIPLKDGWPLGQANNTWKRTIVVPLPSAPQVTPSLESDLVTKTHILKLIMKVTIGKSSSKHELRVEMPVMITGPRPPGEPHSSFDLHRYLSCVDQI